MPFFLHLWTWYSCHIPVGQRSWVRVSPSTYQLKIQYGGNNWRFSETLGWNSRTAAKSTRSSHWNNGAKTSGLWTTNVASALFGTFPTQRRVSCRRRSLICLRFSVSTVKTRVDEPSGLRTCWQEFAFLLNTQKYKNLFSQERLNRFLCVAYNIKLYEKDFNLGRRLTLRLQIKVFACIIGTLYVRLFVSRKMKKDRFNFSHILSWGPKSLGYLK